MPRRLRAARLFEPAVAHRVSLRAGRPRVAASGALLEHALDEQGPHRRRVRVDLGEAAALRLGHELTPRHAFRIRAAGQPAPVRRLRADAHRVLVARRAQVDAEPVVHDVDVGPDLLGPVPRHAPADGEDAQPLRAQGEAGEAVEVEVGVVLGDGGEEIHRDLRSRRLRTLHRPGRDVEAQLGVGEGRHVDGHALLVRAAQHARSPLVLGEDLPQGAAHDLAREHLLAQSVEGAPREFLDVVEVGLHLQGVVHAVVALLEQLLVRHPRVVAVVDEPHRLGQAVRHQRARGHDGLHHAFVDHLGDDLAHLGDGHGAGEGHHDLAVLVLDHGQHHFEGLAEAAAAEGGARHAAEEVGEGRHPIEVETLERDQAVVATVVEFAGVGHGSGDRISARRGVDW